MKTRQKASSAQAFTLIEMIGVIAIIAILSVVITPTALVTIDRAFVRAERDNMRGISSAITEYSRMNGVAPVVATWNTTIASYNFLNPNETLTNRKNVTRRYLVDPAVGGTRVIVISGMRSGLALPAQTTLATLTEFNAVWNTAENAVPATAAWNAWTNFGEYLVIERLNLWTVLQTFPITLKNVAASTASYTVLNPDGSTSRLGPMPPTAVLQLSLRANQRVDLYSDAANSTLIYSYVVSTTGKTFEFNGSTWTWQ